MASPMTRLLPLLLLLPTVADAHPMGRDEYSLRAGVEMREEGVRVILMGEIPMAKVITGLGQLAGGTRPTKAHQAAWNEARYDELAKGQTLTVDGEAVEVTWSPSRSALNGRAIDGFFVYVIEASIPAASLDEDVTVRLQDQAWTEAPMVYSAQARASDGWTVAESTAPDDWTEDAAVRDLTVRFVKKD